MRAEAESSVHRAPTQDRRVVKLGHQEVRRGSSQHEQCACQSVEGLAELADEEARLGVQNYTVVPSKSDQRDSVKVGWHESAPNLADIGAETRQKSANRITETRSR